MSAGRRRWAGLAVLAGGLLVIVMDMTILNVALPDLAADLRPSAVAQLWIVDAYALVLAGALVPLTALGDRVGRRRMLLLGATLFGVASLLVLVATTPGHVIALRALLGLGGAMIMPATLSLIRTLFEEPRERAFALGVWAAMASAGAAIGPVVGGALLEAFSWHAAFLLNVPVMAVLVVAARLLLPESRSATPGRIDAAGVVLSAGGMVALVFAIKALGKAGPNALDLGLLLLGAAALTAFVRRSLRQARPMLHVRLFSVRVFRAGVLAALGTATVMIALLYLASQWLQLVQGWSPLKAGLALLPLAVGGLVGSPLAPGVAGRIGVRPVLVGGLASAAAGLLVLGLAPAPLTYPILAVALLLVGLGSAALSVSSALIMGAARADEAGSAAAVEEMTYEIGGVLGVAVLGSLAGVLYRAGLPAGADEAAREGLAGALGTPAAAQAASAFTDALTGAGLVGGALLVAFGVVVWRLLPARLDLGHAH